MAEIVLMEAWRDRKGRKPETRPAVSGVVMAGEVVWFTGVRYEHFEDRLDRKADNHAIRAEQN